MDYEIQRCSRHCATTGREFGDGESFYSALVVEGAEVERRDYAEDAWRGPPRGTLGWWKSRMPTRESKRMQWAPNEVLLELFRELADQPEKRELRYVMALLLVRRRLMRLEEDAATGDDDEENGEDGDEMVLYCPRDGETYRVAVATPSTERIEEIQEELSRLLFAQPA